MYWVCQDLWEQASVTDWGLKYRERSGCGRITGRIFVTNVPYYNMRRFSESTGYADLEELISHVRIKSVFSLCK